MAGYVLKLGGAAVAILLLGVLGMVIFGNIWARVGIGAAVVIIGGALIFLAWRTDQKEKELRAGLDELPRV